MCIRDSTYTSTITTTVDHLSSGLLQWSLNWLVSLSPCLPTTCPHTRLHPFTCLHIVLIKPWIRSCHSHTLNSPKYSYLIWEKPILFNGLQGPLRRGLHSSFQLHRFFSPPATPNCLLNTPSIFCLRALNLQYPLPGRFSLGAHMTFSLTYFRFLLRFQLIGKVFISHSIWNNTFVP